MLRLGLAIFLICGAAWAQDFSAEIVNLSAPQNTFHTRIFSTKNKLRFQGEDKSGRTNSIMIVNLGARTSIVLLPQQKKYVENKRPQIPGQGVTFFQARDVENACGEWQKMMALARDEDEDAPKKRAAESTGKDKCHKVGHETVDGRDAVKYEDVPASGEANLIWIDVKLHFPVKWKSPVGAGELREIREGSQPRELFEVPREYTKQGAPAGKP